MKVYPLIMFGALAAGFATFAFGFFFDEGFYSPAHGVRFDFGEWNGLFGWGSVVMAVLCPIATARALRK